MLSNTNGQKTLKKEMGRCRLLHKRIIFYQKIISTKIQIPSQIMSVADRHPLDTNLEPAFNFSADQDSTYLTLGQIF
jgi:hypothetical protein